MSYSNWYQEPESTNQEDPQTKSKTIYNPFEQRISDPERPQISEYNLDRKSVV